MKKLYPVFLVLTLAALAVAATFWRSQNQTALPVEQPVVDTQNQATQTQPTPDAAPVSTADWKIYRNDKYGYEIKYPGYWESGDLSANTDKVFIQEALRDTEVAYIFVEAFENPKELSSEQWWLSGYNKGDIKYADYGLTSFNGWSGRAYRELDGFQAGYYIIPKDKKIFLVSTILNDSLMDTVLSTFKFIK